MGNYEITQFSAHAQQIIKEKNIDADKNDKIDEAELQNLLNNVNENEQKSIYKTNSKNNVFLKQYLEGKALQQGVNLPKGFNIRISSPDEFSKEYKQLLRDVRTDIYGARVHDMFNLLVQDKDAVSKRVTDMKISDEDKEKIIKLKEMFDSYYKVEAEYQGKNFNLLNLTEKDLEEMKQISPELAEFMKKESTELKKHTTEFAKKEIKSEELSEAGFWSRVGAPVVMGIMGIGLYRGFAETKQKVKASKDLAGLLKEQKEIYKAGKPGFVNPIKAFGSAFKGAKGKGIAAVLLGGSVLGSYLWKTLLGSLDDLSGCVKDAVQDTDNFGFGKAMAIAVPSAAAGVLSSAFIAPTIDAHIEYNCAEKLLRKHGELPKLKGLNKYLSMGRKGLIGAGLGVIIAACSSGSSWASMAGTRFLFGKNGDDLVKKNIITEEENSSKAANDNMMEYEAYYGKWDGIAKGDPTIGSIGGGLGLFTSTNPYVQNLSFGLQGCSETLTACGVQLAGNKVRESALDKDKKALVESVK